MNTFTADQPSLESILKEIENGRRQLPVFQRSWIWDDYHIRSLIASVSQSFPIGSILTLQAGGAETRFRARLFSGVDLGDDEPEPETLILDGQQRLTALYQSLMCEEGVSVQNTRGTETIRYYYLDMKACLNDGSEREESILSCGEDFQLKVSAENTIRLAPHDAPSRDVNEEYKNEMFPVNKVFNPDDWIAEYQEHWDYQKEKIKFSNRFRREVIEHFKYCQVPVIQIPRETPKEAICLIFEKVNDRGVKLTVFELLTATFAADDFELRDDWDKRYARMKVDHPVLEELESTSFLRSLTLLATRANPNTPISCTRRDILRLTLGEYQEWADKVENGFKEAARFLYRQKIFKANDLPYKPHLVPLAAILVSLGSQSETRMDQEEKIARWYWCGVLGEMYGAAVDTRFANDLSEVTEWVNGNQTEPRTIREANFHENRLLDLRTRNSAAYKGVHALIMHDRDGMRCRDFLTGLPIDEKVYFDDAIDIHHIFPKAWCEEQNVTSDQYNSIINKTPLSAKTNRRIGGEAPSAYLSRLEGEIPGAPEVTNRILASHLICADYLRANDFGCFFEKRKEALLQAIEKVMGENKVIRENDASTDAIV